MIKKLFDFIGSAFLIVLCLPLFILISLAIILFSGGPIFYRQQRIGLQGQTFPLLKFRSMIVNADAVGPYHTAKGDTRITPVGAFLRKTSLDELPQLLNVIRGEMSLVGPRPDVPEQKNLYTVAEWQQRHQVLPGITGLAQATLRSAATFKQRKNLDLFYAKHHSLCLDLKIMFITVKQILRQGSY